MSDEVGHLGREVGLLIRRLRSWAGSSWDVALESGLTRAERTRRLLDELAALSERIGAGAPAGARPPRLAPHALPDQLAVLAEDVLAAIAAAGPGQPPAERTPGRETLASETLASETLARETLADALAAVSGTRADLEGGGFGFRVR